MNKGKSVKALPDNFVMLDLLILGNNDYCRSIKGGKSSKQKKAEEYAAKGLDIQIISENVFYELMGL